MNIKGRRLSSNVEVIPPPDPKQSYDLARRWMDSDFIPDSDEANTSGGMYGMDDDQLDGEDSWNSTLFNKGDGTAPEKVEAYKRLIMRVFRLPDQLAQDMLAHLGIEGVHKMINERSSDELEQMQDGVRQWYLEKIKAKGKTPEDYGMTE